MISAIAASLLMIDVAGLTIRSLAVVGGAVLGGLGVGGLGGLLARATTTRKLPPRFRWVLRSLGGVASGWILALFLFGGGSGLGIGGPGGWGLGEPDGGTGPAAVRELPSQEETAVGDTGHSLSSPSSNLRIEVLGDEPLRKLNPEGRLDSSHCYRIDGEQPPKLHTLQEIKQLVKHRLTQKPALKHIEVVLYKDSPGRKVRRAADLEGWLDDLVAAQKDPTFSYVVNDKVPSNAPVHE
jgi:hypothetical protein